VREELELARAFGGERTLGVTLRTAGVVIGGREGEGLLREAVQTLERCGVALERARTLTELGALLRRANRRSEARGLLREALDIAHHAGARPVADRAETELRATGAKPRRARLTGVEALTASERRVAELAAQSALGRVGGPRAAHALGGQGGQVDLPVLRRGLRPARLRQGREGHPDRGRPRLADLARAAVPQALGLQAAPRAPRARVRGQVPPPARPSGRSSTSTRQWT